MTTYKTDYGFIKPTHIEEEMRTSYLDYAMSVIVSRALPDVRDGLKPVQRRILYAMEELGMRPGQGYKKSARLVGEVLGKYHPHNNDSVYEAMVRMAQDFTMRLPLVDGQGNFGSVDNDPPAAMRYTEARMQAVAEEMLVNIDENTVDHIDNFDGTLREPVVLPARLPNLMINGASGIAVGMATNIPPHNPTEICNAVVHLVDHPDATVEDLLKHVQGPDFPTGGTIMGREGIRNAYSTGRGQIIVRAKAEIEPMSRSNRMQIIVSELPYQVNKAALVEKIANLTKDKRLQGISEVRDESDREGMRVVIELRTGTQPMVVLNNLYKLTPMQNSFSANMLALVEGMPRTITLKVALLSFIDFRREVVRRRAEFQLEKARQRAHILAGLRIAVSNLDEVIAIIRGAADTPSARDALMTRFSLDEPQSQAILDMQLRRISTLERERLEEEYAQIQTTIQGLEELLGDENKIMLEIKKETRALRKKFGEDRRTDISLDAHDISRAELEAHEQVVVTLSQGGYIKRIPANTYRNQHRGGKGVVSMTTREDDPVKHLLVADTHDTLLFFTNRGRVHKLTVFELRPDTSRNTRGVPVVNVVQLGANETVSAVVAVDSLDHDDTFLMLGTRNGKIKRIALSSIGNIRPSGGVLGMRLQKKGSEIGKRKLSQDDRVVGMAIILHNSDSRLLVISKKGFGKLTAVDKYRRQGRGGKGILTFDIQPRKTGPVAVAEVVDDSKELYLVSEQAQVQRTNLSEISTTIGRKASGVIIMRLASGDSVSSIACVSDLDSGTSATGKSNGKGNAEASKPAAESKNGTANAQRNGSAKAELVDADEESDEPQMSFDDMTEEDDETDSDD
ncbi:DNA gyrase subunit A [Geodia barretti]|uniref:DNA topoisomerase (ATP-hydrolyzing) n=1 Tax=Geodia barretti TaxID=519541 RepID=A0AA35TU79_GEOBA|nr:DNA gyrase subunit A [Geodia barretti]